MVAFRLLSWLQEQKHIFISGEGKVGPRSNRTFGTWDFRIKKKKRLDSTDEKEMFKNNIEMEKRLVSISCMQEFDHEPLPAGLIVKLGMQ